MDHGTPGYLVVDLGGVVFHFDHPHRLDRLAEACDLGAEEIHALLWRSGFSAECDQGRRGSAVQVRAQIRAALAFRGPDDDLDEAWCSAFRPDPAVLDVLDRHRGDRALALFTNNGPLEEEALTRRYPEVLARFGHLFFSHRLGHRKPDPAAFAAVTSALGDDLVFIDDSPANVSAALSAGWRAVRFRDADSLHTAIEP
jgi:putative hydrolase of the HAD superfamily